MLACSLEDQAEFLTHTNEAQLSMRELERLMERDNIRAGAKQKDHAVCDHSIMSVC